MLLIEPVVGIIEDKRSGGNAHKKKKEAWQKVIDGFIAIFGTTRTLAQLKEAWKRLKISAKKDWSRFDREKRGTGGGPPPKEPSAISIQLRDLIPREFMVLDNQFDDDAEDNIQDEGEFGRDMHVVGEDSNDNSLDLSGMESVPRAVPVDAETAFNKASPASAE